MRPCRHSTRLIFHLISNDVSPSAYAYRATNGPPVPPRRVATRVEGCGRPARDHKDPIRMTHFDVDRWSEAPAGYGPLCASSSRMLNVRVPRAAPSQMARKAVTQAALNDQDGTTPNYALKVTWTDTQQTRETWYVQEDRDVVECKRPGNADYSRHRSVCVCICPNHSCWSMHAARRTGVFSADHRSQPRLGPRIEMPTKDMSRTLAALWRTRSTTRIAHHNCR